MPHNRSLYLASVVILLALLSLRHPVLATPTAIQWSRPDSVNLPYWAHMATLQSRRIGAAIASIISIR